MRDPCAHGDRRVTCGACLQRYCATCQGPACPHPAQEIEPAPLLDEGLEEARRIATLFPEGLVAGLLSTLDQERALRQAAERERDEWSESANSAAGATAGLIVQLEAAETALAAARTDLDLERQARATAEIERDSFRDMWMHGRRAADLAVEEMEQSDAKATEWARRILDMEAERDQARAALAACEARLAEAEQWRDFYQSALRCGRTAFDAGDMKEARTAFSCGLVSAPNEQDLAWAKAWLATEEGQQVLAEVQQAHPAPPPVEETPTTLVCTRKHCPVCTPPATPAPADRIAPEDRADGPGCG